ncbi:MAG: alpha-amylase family glycosyl hydrolase [Treponemataceae bacterium]|nr:alpha-amylase family glycosyl hydrolase [Treponemataceae bacterium]
MNTENQAFDQVFTINPAISETTPQPHFEFHVSRAIRERCQFDGSLFSTTGNVILANFKNVRLFAKKINDTIDPVLHPEQMIKAGQLNAMGLIDEIFHYVCYLYRRQIAPKAFAEALALLDDKYGKESVDQLLLDFTNEFPPADVYRNIVFPETYLESINPATGINNRITTLEEMVLLHLANENPAFEPFFVLFNDKNLNENPLYAETWVDLKKYFSKLPPFGPNSNTLINMLKEPVLHSPTSLRGQLDYIRSQWADLLGEWLKRLLAGIDLMNEEEKPNWQGFGGPGGDGLPPMDPYNYDYLTKEYERYSPDREWMPRVVLMAKTVLVWLDQLTKKYQRPINRLDLIPDEELDLLAQRGFTGLWLIGLWERSTASCRIKQINGNPEAAASAYSLEDYNIANNLGGWDALDNLRRRCWQRGIRLASDMVPNHTGMDAKWVVERPDMFIQRRDCPFPTYTFNGENLSHDSRVSVYLEDHYYSKNDCAVVFKRVDNYTGDTRYIYHGNDGTGLPWNDTAQIDFLNPEAREAVIQEILHVARNFPIIRFDAAMVLAKKHIKRLWYPEPGSGGDIASRSESALSREEFENRIPNEFWREVVDRCAKEIPDTLLLAEAFWMMEGYFVRTLGMHRVYNSAFMNMLKKEENYKYRQTVKNTLEFDPQVLRRFVNFMNNPDEETAVAQFGRDDKYFGVCTLMVTMPGLPMFGHGQIEGFTEKYGMEYQKAYYDEQPDENLIARHNREIFPLMKKRYLFAEVENFYFYDVWNNGSVNENVFAYSNSFGDEKAVVFYNNVYQQAVGWIKESCRYAVKTGEETSEMHTCSIANALKLSTAGNAFCIFQEQRSGLWYIRTCEEIHKNGLYMCLNGFESQVLLNFSEVFDDETGKYRILYETLNGSGVEDIQVALQEIFLKDLYKALCDFVTSDFTGTFASLCESKAVALAKAAALKESAAQTKDGKKTAKTEKPKKLPTLAALLKANKEAGIKYFETFAEFVKGNYGAAQIVNLAKTGESVAAEKCYKAFGNTLAEIIEIKKAAEEPSATKQQKELYQTLLAKPNGAEYAFVLALLAANKGAIGKKATSSDAAKLAEQWGLNRKLFSIVKKTAIADTSLWYYQALTPVLLCTSTAPADKKTTKEAAYFTISTLFENKNAPALTGLNTFDNVRWFGKEQTERALEEICFAQNLFKGKKAEDFEACAKLLVKTCEEAQYKADDFLAALAPAVKKPAKKARTKTAGTAAKASGKTAKTAKTPAAKTAAKAKAEKAEKPKTEKPATKAKKPDKK